VATVRVTPDDVEISEMPSEAPPPTAIVPLGFEEELPPHPEIPTARQAMAATRRITV